MTTGEKIRVVLAEPMPLFLQGVLREVEQASDIVIVGTATTGAETIELCRTVDVDLAVMAIHFMDCSGLHVLEQLPEVPILFLTHERESETVLEAMLLGARGFLLKWDHTTDISDAIRRAARGECVMSEESLRTFIATARTHMKDAIRGGTTNLLSPREREMLALISRGNRPNEIAQILSLSPSTVRGYCRSAYRKLGVKNQAAAVREAMERGLIPDHRLKE